MREISFGRNWTGKKWSVSLGWDNVMLFCAGIHFHPTSFVNGKMTYWDTYWDASAELLGFYFNIGRDRDGYAP